MDLALLFLRIAAAAVQVVGKGGFDDPEVVERAAGEGWSEAKGGIQSSVCESDVPSVFCVGGPEESSICFEIPFHMVR